MEERSEYDKIMIEKFNTEEMRFNNGNYHTPPWPGKRSKLDNEMHYKWQPITENYAPLHGFRTSYDIKLQNKWCPDCNYE